MEYHRAKFPVDSLVKRKVYFIGCQSLVKIGCSKDPLKRMAEIQTWVPYPLTMLAVMPGNVRVENNIHSIFADEWSHSEWFHCSPRLYVFISDILAGNIPEIPDMPTNAYRQQIIHEVKQKKNINRMADAMTQLESEK